MKLNSNSDKLGKGMAKLKKDETVLPTKVDNRPKTRVQIDHKTWIETSKSPAEARAWYNRRFPDHA